MERINKEYKDPEIQELKDGLYYIKYNNPEALSDREFHKMAQDYNIVGVVYYNQKGDLYRNDHFEFSVIEIDDRLVKSNILSLLPFIKVLFLRKLIKTKNIIYTDHKHNESI